MKPSVPWLLISSAITLPLSSIVAAEPLLMASLSKAQSQEQNGNQTLSSTDNYDGTSQTDTPFTRKESSTEGGTTYTLESDVSFTNISKTQLPSASETQKESKDVKPTDASSENKSTSSDQTSEKSSSDHSTPNAESPNQESTAETAQPSPTEPSTPTANAVSDENTPKTETTAEPTDQGATDTAQATEEPNKNTNAETPLVSSHRIRANTEPAGVPPHLLLTKPALQTKPTLLAKKLLKIYPNHKTRHLILKVRIRKFRLRKANPAEIKILPQLRKQTKVVFQIL
ncbi:hypothetical protein [Chlamydia caviae]|uniref:hypothetical protein n=1 Tax=Chlamydia caviae TaxID=83557 RepID=UPI0003181ABE